MSTHLVLWSISLVILGAALPLTRRLRTAMPQGASFERLRQAPSAAISGDWDWEVVLPSEAPRRKAPAGTHERRLDPFSPDTFARLCGKFGVRTISVLPGAGQPLARGGASVQILVVFEAGVEMDSTLIFRLRQEMLGILGKQVDLVCRDSEDVEADKELLATARVLYAA